MVITSDVNICYKPVYFTNKRYIDICGGRGRGGSHFVTQRFLEKITSPEYFRGYFIRKIKADIYTSLYQDFKDRVAEHPTLTEDDFVFNETKYTIICRATGNVIMSRGTTSSNGRTANMKSLAGATALAIEEFDELGEDEFDQLDLSLRKINSRIEVYRIYNMPPVHHWMWRDFNMTEVNITYPNGKVVKYYKPEPKSDSDILMIHTTYQDNLKNLNESTITKFKSFEQRRPEYYYNQIAGLVGTGNKGQIYSDWQKITDQEFDEIDSSVIYGIDFGYGNHATAIVAVKKDGENLYCKEVLFETAILDTFNLKRRLKALGMTKNDIFVADGGGGGNVRVAEMRQSHSVDGEELYFTVYLAHKYPGSVLDGIAKIQNLNVYTTEGSTNIWREYREYKWLLNTNKEPTDKPNKDADVDNTLDAIRYAVITRIN